MDAHYILGLHTCIIYTKNEKKCIAYLSGKFLKL